MPSPVPGAPRRDNATRTTQEVTPALLVAHSSLQSVLTAHEDSPTSTPTPPGIAEADRGRYFHSRSDSDGVILPALYSLDHQAIYTQRANPYQPPHYGPFPYPGGPFANQFPIGNHFGNVTNPYTSTGSASHQETPQTPGGPSPSQLRHHATASSTLGAPQSPGHSRLPFGPARQPGTSVTSSRNPAASRSAPPTLFHHPISVSTLPNELRHAAGVWIGLLGSMEGDARRAAETQQMEMSSVRLGAMWMIHDAFADATSTVEARRERLYAGIASLEIVLAPEPGDALGDSVIEALEVGLGRMRAALTEAQGWTF